MLIRIVRLTFSPEEIDAFLALFEESAPKIRAFEGCRHLELWQDARFPNIFTTYSHWDDTETLERYRKSTLFQSTWERTKPLFAGPPQAHSYMRRERLSP